MLLNRMLPWLPWARCWNGSNNAEEIELKDSNIVFGLTTQKYPCDLHCHTTRSDGSDSPKELIDNAAALGMYAIAITDHDIIPPSLIELTEQEPVDIEKYAAQRGIIFVPGYEFSTDTWVDEVHICGYNLDWSHPDLLEEVDTAARSKSEAYKELCVRLVSMGIEIDWKADILHYVTPDGDEATRKPEEVQRKHIFETIAAKGYAESWSQAKLMVRDNPDLNVRRRKIDPSEAIQLIHHCGGIAVLAHPYLIDEHVMVSGKTAASREDYINQLITDGLDGIEVRYTYDKTTYKGSLSPEEIEKETRSLYADQVCILSGGSDYHADHKKGVRNSREIGERGLMIEEFNLYFGDSSACS